MRRNQTAVIFVPNLYHSNQTVSEIIGKLQLNPQKLLLSKWAAVKSRDKKKHYLVARVINPELPRHKIHDILKLWCKHP